MTLTIGTLNSDWGNIELDYLDATYSFPFKNKTGEVFNTDPSWLIRIKCIELLIVTPIVSLVRCISWFVEAIFLSFREVFRYVHGESPLTSRQVIQQKAWDSVRALGYGFLMTKSALKGILSPELERETYGYYERVLNRHSDGPHRDKYYLAFCFQRLCILSKNDPSNQEHVRQKLCRYIDKLESFERAFYAN